MNGLSKQAIILCCVVALAIVFVGCGGQTDATPETPSADIASKATTRPMPTAVPRDSATVTVAEPTVALRPAATAPPVPTPAAPSPGTTSLSTAVPAMTAVPISGPAATAAPLPPGATMAPMAAAAPAAETGVKTASESEAAASPTAVPAMPAATAAPMPASEDHFSGEGTGRGEITSYVPVSLSAGEVDDNEKWEEYLGYRDRYVGPAVHDVDVSERYIISVRDSSNRTVPNAKVRVSAGPTSIYEGTTYANGQTLFFPRAFPESEGVEMFQVYVEKDGASQSLDVARHDETEWKVTLDVGASFAGGVPLDVLFLLDATGSMSDEIGQIKATLLSISGRIADLPARPDLRLGMVSYRDRGDTFVTRLYDFERDVPRFLESIRGVEAYGGGDEPESLNEAMHEAVHEPEWRLGDAIRLVFLVADAPPHLDYAQDYDYAVEMAEASRRGIKIFSIASSGLNQSGEYIFRQIAQHTMGRFIFLLYDGGAEGPTTPHDVSEYTIERLDDLVVRLVEEELAVLSP